ncbi:MAG: hypothetical protein GY731_17220, partial [Gammaproteobacteria bacterium]|nr:hypothetical protein [Gammaproteobacteria bacterium]
MARIPDAQIERLKTEVSIQRLAESAGISFKRHGADLLGLCPFHDDKEPSLVISPKKNLWHCLGACQTGGSVIDWVMKVEGVSFRHAVELLQADYVVPGGNVAVSKPVGRSTVRKLPTALESDVEDTKLLLQVVDYYHETLKQSPEALDYLKKRGIADPEVIDRFKLGFANRTLGYRLPAKNRKEGAAIRGRLQQLGLYRTSGHEHFTGSLVIPVMSMDGRYAGAPSSQGSDLLEQRRSSCRGGSAPANGQDNVLEIYGRKITDKLRKGTPLHLYLPGLHAGVWNIEALAV